MMRALLSFGFLALFSISSLVGADERILNYHSDIEVHEDGDLTVTETITVRAELINIRRGIYRDIPSRYKDRLGRRMVVPIDVVSVKRDGSTEDWHTESVDGGIRIYAGSADRYLSKGEYTYEFTYTTKRQIGFFDEHDEIYWNATGNGWMFPINQASATVRLPSGADLGDLQIAAYTGSEGATGKNARYEITGTGVVEFHTTRGLNPYEGLTVAVGFAKGVVPEPSAMQKRIWFFRDNLGLILATALMLAALMWYVHAWRKVGRDPATGAIYPRYEAPKGYSPGMLRYVWRMGYDTRTFAAALVNMAVHGIVELSKEGKKYIATKREGTPSVVSERKLLDKLIDGNRIVFKRSNHSDIRSGLSAHETALSDALEGKYFNHNRKWITPGILLSLGALAAMVLLLPGEDKMIGVMVCVFAMIWAAAALFLILRAVRAWRDRSGVGSTIHAIGATLFATPFTLAGLAMLAGVGVLLGPLQLLVLVSVIGLNVLFYQLLKAPTPDGRRLLDEIEGLRLYLNVAERDDFESIHAAEPPKTLERFEKLLPYAIALDCAETWAEHFASEIEAAQQSGELSRAHWYGAAIHGSSFSASALTSGISSGLSSAISSSSTAPGSSSGSSGGGFSGGGGGGGGGGGW